LTTATPAGADILAIATHLRPAVRDALAGAGAALADGGLLAIRDAFDPGFAEHMFRCLDACPTWRLHEGYEDDFHYQHHNLYDPREFPPDLARCAMVFDSPATKAWAGRLSGRACGGPVEFSASWYLPDDHSLPHNDVGANDALSHRRVAYVWHLARHWRPEWGGALYWCAKSTYLPPAFNTLYLFNVGPGSDHFVTHVSPYAQAKRLAINGWWTGAEAAR
jgi:Rps23 Pro-64 3,4-dihydroxylase Tpa1-like proline 4-hydroxylase